MKENKKFEVIIKSWVNICFELYLKIIWNQNRKLTDVDNELYKNFNIF